MELKKTTGLQKGCFIYEEHHSVLLVYVVFSDYAGVDRHVVDEVLYHAGRFRRLYYDDFLYVIVLFRPQ